MPHYIAYQFEPQQLTRKRLARILDDYFDLELKEGYPKNSNEWFDFVQFELQEIKGRLKTFSKRTQSRFKQLIGPELIRRAEYFASSYTVKNHPLLEISFEYSGIRLAA